MPYEEISEPLTNFPRLLKTRLLRYARNDKKDVIGIEIPHVNHVAEFLKSCDFGYIRAALSLCDVAEFA